LSTVHQVLSGAGPVDAVTQQAFEYQRVLGGEVYAAAIEPAVRGRVRSVKRLDPAPDDLLLFHYSAYAPRLEPLLEMPQRKLLVYHNVTPAEYLWEHQPHVATLCALGRDHLPRWAQAVDVAAAVSEYNAAELREAGARDVRVVPILLRRAPVVRASGMGSGPVVLSVGRLAPHKRPDLVLQAFDLFRRSAPDARLYMVGEPLSPAYERELRALAGPGVEITGRLAQEGLDELWSRADMLLTLSEHEGFCVPLLEAFHADVPVIARPAGGMPEVAGDAALWVNDGDPAVGAELMHLVTQDQELREELITRGRARAAEYAPDRVEDQIRAAVDVTKGV
jgi:glycosyltransferase involved in cell wall biosynthesis